MGRRDDTIRRIALMEPNAETHQVREAKRIMPTHLPCPVPWHVQALALLRKDLQAELRTRVAINAVGLFTFSSLLLLAMATASLKGIQFIDGRGVLRPAWDAQSKMGLLWVLLFFAAFAGLAHSFVHEEETGTSMALRLTMLPEAVYAGKLLFNLFLLLCVASFVTPVYMLITGMPMGDYRSFIPIMFSGCVGLAGTATIIAALTARVQATGALYGALGLPILVVFLLLLLNAAHTLYIRDAPVIQIVKNVGGLLSFGVILITLSAILFRIVWEE